MKTLQKRVKIIYRFRCRECRSKFEMTDEEKRENDINFTEDWANQLENREKYGWTPHPHNPDNKFNCPVCGGVRTAKGKIMHKYSVMDDGTEFMDY